MVIRLPVAVNIPYHYFAKPYDIIIETRSERVIAIDRHGNLLHDGDNLNDVFNAAKDYCPSRCKISISGEFVIKRPLVVDRSDVLLDGFGAKIEAGASMDAMIIIDGKTANPYRVVVMGFYLNGNNLANAGIIGYTSTTRAPIDAIISGNTVIKTNGAGIGGYFYNTLIARNVSNYNNAGYNISGGQHVTLFDNVSYMNRAPSLILGIVDTCHVIRHKSLSDNLQNTYWRTAIALTGLKMHALSHVEIWTSDSIASSAILVWRDAAIDKYRVVLRDVMIRDEGDRNHSYLVHVKVASDDHIVYIDGLDSESDDKYSYRIYMERDTGYVYLGKVFSSLSDTGYTTRIIS